MASDVSHDRALAAIRAYLDHDTFCRESLRVQDLGGSLVAFEPWPSQMKLARRIDQIKRRKEPVRLVILKTRRSGFTMGSTSQMFHDCAFLPGRKGLVIADRYEPAGDEAFGYLEQFHRFYRPMQREGLTITLPEAKIKKSAPKRILWGEGDVDDDAEKDVGSRITVLSAEAGDVGRGGGRHFVLGDEVAFWRDATTTLNAVLNMVPKLPETSVILQSTANGQGGEFYEMVQKAQAGLGWEFLFFGWLEHPIYRLPVENAAKLQASLDKEELTLLEMHGASLEQIQWRRVTIDQECRGKVDVFHQEYPTTPEEAFIASGRTVFDMGAITKMPITEPEAGELEIVEDRPVRRLVFLPKKFGALHIFERPKKGHLYVIGADPSKGIDVNPDKRGHNPDYSAAFVIDRSSGVQVALLRDRIRPVPFGEYLAYLGRYYNWAYMVPEANDAGFIDSILQSGYPLELIYKRQRDPTDQRPQTIQEIGYETNSLTRSWLIAAGDDAIRSFSIVIRSGIVTGECRTFVRKPDGKSEHMDNAHDDTVIALCLSAIGLRFAPTKAYEHPDGTGVTKVRQYGLTRRRPDDD